MRRLWGDKLKYTIKNFSGSVKRYFLGASTFPSHKYSPSPTLILETLFRNYYVIRKFPIFTFVTKKDEQVSYHNISDYVKIGYLIENELSVCFGEKNISKVIPPTMGFFIKRNINSLHCQFYFSFRTTTLSRIRHDKIYKTSI